LTEGGLTTTYRLSMGDSEMSLYSLLESETAELEESQKRILASAPAGLIEVLEEEFEAMNWQRRAEVGRLRAAIAEKDEKLEEALDKLGELRERVNILNSELLGFVRSGEKYREEIRRLRAQLVMEQCRD